MPGRGNLVIWDEEGVIWSARRQRHRCAIAIFPGALAAHLSVDRGHIYLSPQGSSSAGQNLWLHVEGTVSDEHVPYLVVDAQIPSSM